jgi:hypothetical protein
MCLLEKELRASHLMPRSLYLKTRGSGTKGNQDPVLLTARGSKHTSHQIKDYVFCSECEGRLDRNGERYVMPLVTQRDGKFPLFNILNGIQPDSHHPKALAYSRITTPDIDREKIAYFAISVFWRASVHAWEQENGTFVSIDLGKKYNEEIRSYLMGEAGIPKNAFLNVAVCVDLKSQAAFFPPSINVKQKDRGVAFGARGVLFFLRMSNTLTELERAISMINNPYGWIAVRDCFESGLWRVDDGS